MVLNSRVTTAKDLIGCVMSPRSFILLISALPGVVCLGFCSMIDRLLRVGLGRDRRSTRVHRHTPTLHVEPLQQDQDLLVQLSASTAYAAAVVRLPSLPHYPSCLNLGDTTVKAGMYRSAMGKAVRMPSSWGADTVVQAS